MNFTFIGIFSLLKLSNITRKITRLHFCRILINVFVFQVNYTVYKMFMLSVYSETTHLLLLERVNSVIVNILSASLKEDYT